jgi:transposase
MTITPDYVGIDVSKATLDIFDAAIGRSERIENARAPVAALVKRLKTRNVFVVFEATGQYDRLLRKALAAAAVPFARVNPLRARDFARAAGFLAKTDRVDTRMLAKMGQCLRPDADGVTPDALERLRCLHRRRDQLVQMRAQERTRRSEASEREERTDIDRHIVWLSAQIKTIEGRIKALITADAQIRERCKRLRQAPGIGPVAATTLVAAVRKCHHFKAFYETLVKAGKAKKLALIAVARKLLIALNAMIRDNADFRPA